jgi:hypothetical protein
MSFSTLLFALAQLVALAAAGAATGHLLVQQVWPGRSFGAPERGIVAVLGAVVFAVAMMLVHIVTGGLVFGTPGLVWLPAVAVIGFAARSILRPSEATRSTLPLARPRFTTVAAAAGFALVLLAIYAAPAISSGSSLRTGDPPWHLGWSQQLLAGEALPSGPAPEFGRNAYPWGYHATIATMSRLVPGSTPLHAHEALHLLFLFALPLTAAALARLLDRRAGWAAAAATSLVGGWGWLAARTPAFAASPSDARFGADLVVASPNSVYELFPPALPRELGLLVVGIAAWFIAQAVRGSTRSRVLAGGTVGLAGLVSVPMFISGVAWMIAACLTSGRQRVRCLLTMGGTAVAVFLTWATYVLIGYLRFDGFVSTTPKLGREYELWAALGSWGLLLVGAVAGAALIIRRAPKEHAVFLAFGAASLILLVLATLRGAFDWDLAGNATVLHQGRIWPPAHLLGGVLAGVAALAAFDALRRRSRTSAWAMSAVIVAVGLASPVLASQALSDIMENGRDGYIYGAEQVSAPDSFVQRAAAQLSSDDIVEVAASDQLAFLLWQFSGARLASYDDERLDRNDLRIRYEGLAKSWDERTARGGFEPSHQVLPAADSPPPGSEASVSGRYDGIVWTLYRLDAG